MDLQLDNTSQNSATLPAEKLSQPHGGQDQSERQEKEMKYPKSVFFIVSNEFCERFSYYGMRTVLAIYLRTMLNYSENDATVIYHTFVMLCYFFPLFGAIIADCYLGRFKTIFYLSIVYALGNIVLSVGSDTNLPVNQKVYTLGGLFLIAVGTGGIKPCVSSFGGDQFIIPQQEHQLQQFFSVFYFAINAGSLISTFLTPIFRTQKCLGQATCYPLAFGVPAVLMITSLLIFLCGKSMYTIKKPEGNVITEVGGCVGRAVYRKVTSHEKRDHWLEYADDKYSKKLIRETKIFLEIIYLFTPTILFWALYEQQGSRWTFQATHLNGQLWDGYVIRPDQTQVVNPVLILVFIPLFETVVYPFLSKVHLVRTPLQKISWGGILAVIAFVLSAVLEFRIQESYAKLPSQGEAHLRIYNSFNCNVSVTNVDSDLMLYNNFTLNNTGLLELKDVKVTGCKNMSIMAVASKDLCPQLSTNLMWFDNITVFEEKAVSYILTGTADELKLIRVSKSYDDLKRDENSIPKLRIVYSLQENISITMTSLSGNVVNYDLVTTNYSSNQFKIDAGSYSLQATSNSLNLSKTDLKIEPGGVYLLLLTQNNYELDLNLFAVTQPNTIYMFWILPQIIVITMAEIMFSITGLEFSFTQAPASMKSLISSLWLLTDGVGNLIVVVISEATSSINQAYVLLLFAGLMFAVMGVFILLAMRYEYVTPEVEDNEYRVEGSNNSTFQCEE